VVRYVIKSMHVSRLTQRAAGLEVLLRVGRRRGEAAIDFVAASISRCSCCSHPQASKLRRHCSSPPRQHRRSVFERSRCTWLRWPHRALPGREYRMVRGFPGERRIGTPSWPGISPARIVFRARSIPARTRSRGINALSAFYGHHGRRGDGRPAGGR
jgi:hypothetical protein